MSALLRMAGLPIRTWLAGSAPDLFELVRALDHAEETYRERAAALAERLGEELVPRPELRVADRRLVLSVRRSLHQGRHADTTRLRTIVTEGLLPDVDQVTRLSARLRELEELTRLRIDAEHERLLALPWELVGSSLTLDSESFDIVADIRRRLSEGEPWSSKRLRKSSDYLWRMIARGSVKTTPRAWLGQVALVPLAEPDELETHAVAELSVDDRVATEWTQNVHTHRVGLARAEQLDPDHRISLPPLHRLEDGRLTVWTVDPSSPTPRAVMSNVRLALGLDEVVRLLGSRTRTVAELTRELPDVSPALLAKLARRGVLEVSAPLEQQRRRWRTITERDTPGDTGFVDVYRRTRGALSPDLAMLQHAFEQCRRIFALIRAERSPAEPAFTGRVGPQPRPVLDVFAEEATAQFEKGELALRPLGRSGWPAALQPGSGYARLLDLIASSDGPVSITAETLDALGAPRAPLRWPVDCLLRPMASGGWVLDNSGPAGVLDARFVETLRWLHGSVPAADDYRAFLAELDRLTGIPSVELLVPPLAERAANAVRRPRFTKLWTGDPHAGHYGSSWDEGADGFLPLGELSVHRADDGRIVISHAGRPLRILQHATRTPMVPWTVMNGILCADSPQRTSHTLRLGLSLRAHPQRAFVPRIDVAGSLVISVAQWAVDAGRLAPVGGGDLAELRALSRLRAELGLPRWVFVSGPYGEQPLACDLESLRALRVFEQTLKTLVRGDGPRTLTISEMLPAPDELPVRAAAEHVAAEILLRLPYGLTPQELAARAAREPVSVP
ncbi:lantibiotic dehydratase [Planotetraspora sp. GP83]|uniref:lantibiotic dehydratase n=1 Tax=Planotetraspora sp. GP83 TaxID=3156264 RepID=UPI003518CA72